jgi:hypothetical protein
LRGHDRIGGVRHSRLHLLLGVQSLVVVLVSVNRLGAWTLGYVAPNQFLRWIDLDNMILALVSVVAFHLLRGHLEYPSPARDAVAYLVGLILTAAKTLT